MDIRRVACDTRERTEGDILLLLIRLSYWEKKQQAVIMGRASKTEPEKKDFSGHKKITRIRAISLEWSERPNRGQYID